MAEAESAGLIFCVQGVAAGYAQAIRAGSAVRIVEDFPTIDDALTHRTPEVLGIIVPVVQAGEALRKVSLADGLAKAVGGADSIGFSRSLPGSFGFLAMTGGIVAAFRQRSHPRQRPLTDLDARLDIRGPRAWAALAALVQLRISHVDGGGDPFISGVAHRLGIELHKVDNPDVIVSLDGVGVQNAADFVSWSDIDLWTAAAQVRLFTAKEPNLDAMREVLLS